MYDSEYVHTCQLNTTQPNEKEMNESRKPA